MWPVGQQKRTISGKGVWSEGEGHGQSTNRSRQCPIREAWSEADGCGQSANRSGPHPIGGAWSEGEGRGLVFSPGSRAWLAGVPGSSRGPADGGSLPLLLVLHLDFGLDLLPVNLNL